MLPDLIQRENVNGCLSREIFLNEVNKPPELEGQHACQLIQGPQRLEPCNTQRESHLDKEFLVELKHHSLEEYCRDQWGEPHFEHPD